MTARRRRRGSVCGLRAVVLVATAFAILSGAAPAFAECTSQTPCRPWWHLDSSAAPTNLPPGDREAKLVITASNLGDAPADGSKRPITITDTLPAGLRAVSMSGQLGTPGKKGKPGQMVCPDQAELKEKDERKETELSCTYGEAVEPYELLEVAITVEVQSSLTGGVVDEASVTGGEGPDGGEPQTQQLRRTLSVSAAPTPFGIERVSLTPENEDGSPDTQAGSHPFQLTTGLDLNQAIELNAKRKVGLRSSPALAKDLQFNLPPGLIGNPQAVDAVLGSRLHGDRERGQRMRARHGCGGGGGDDQRTIQSGCSDHRGSGVQPRPSAGRAGAIRLFRVCTSRSCSTPRCAPVAITASW